MMYSRSRVLYGSARAGASLLWSRSPLSVFEANVFWVAASLTLVILSAAAATQKHLASNTYKGDRDHNNEAPARAEPYSTRDRLYIIHSANSQNPCRPSRAPIEADQR